MAKLIQRVIIRLKRIWWSTTLLARMRSLGVEIADEVRIYGMPIVSMEANSRVRIGARCVICSSSQFTALGVNHPTVIVTLRAGAEIEIGEDTGISGGSICAAKSIKIGSSCLIGANVTLADTDFHALSPNNRRYNKNPDEIATAPILIEDNVFIGTGAIVLKGVTIGRNSIIGAGSVVVSNIPANSIAAGNPARVIKTIETAQC